MSAEVPGSSTGTKLKSFLPVFRKYFKSQNMFVAIRVSYPKNCEHELERKTTPLHPRLPKNDVSILMKCVACATLFFNILVRCNMRNPWDQ